MPVSRRPRSDFARSTSGSSKLVSSGGSTLSSYETALKAIAGAVERGPGTSDIDWISQLAMTRAKFIRDVTDAWTSAARAMLK
jgi:hypothetical protein